MLRRSRITVGWAILAASIALFSTVTTGPALAETLTIEPSLDNSIYEEVPNRSNGAGPHLYAGRTTAGNVRRALLAFDLSSIPSDAIVTDVALTLVMNNGIPTPYTFQLHRATAEWGEGTSNAGTPGGFGAPATEDDATWSHRLWPDEIWDSEGGDYDATAAATLDVAGSGSHVFTGGDLRSDVQAWVEGSAPNYGWLMRGDESSIQSAKRFGSAEHTDPSQRPVLEVTYMTPVPTDEESWSAIKERFRD